MEMHRQKSPFVTFICPFHIEMSNYLKNKLVQYYLTDRAKIILLFYMFDPLY